MELNLREKYCLDAHCEMTAAFISNGSVIREQHFTTEQTQLLLAVESEFNLGMPEVLEMLKADKNEQPLAVMYSDDDIEDKRAYEDLIDLDRQRHTSLIEQLETMCGITPKAHVSFGYLEFTLIGTDELSKALIAAARHNLYLYDVKKYGETEANVRKYNPPTSIGGLYRR